MQANYDQIQTRLDAMYLDKLDGRIDAPFFDRKSADWRRDQDGILRNIQVHQDADQSYIEDGIQLLELASDAHELFLEQEPREKRRLLAFMVSSASWKEGEFSVNLRHSGRFNFRTPPSDRFPIRKRSARDLRKAKWRIGSP